MRVWSVAGAAACLMLSGCGNFNSIWRDSYVRNGSVITVDAKQRFLRATADATGPLRICAEKSPDVFSAYAGATSISGSYQGVEAAFSGSNAEQAASIALRTQLTQAQGELLSRICDLHANGAITGAEVATQLRRFQNTMTAMLAIEQLTARSPVTTVALTTQATGSTGAAAEDLRKDLEKANEARKNADDAVLEQEVKVRDANGVLAQAKRNQAAGPGTGNPPTTTAGALATALTDAQTRADEENLELAKRKGTQRQMQANAAAAQRAFEVASASVRTGAAGTALQLSNAQAASNAHRATAEAVRDIVSAVIEQSFMQETCLQLLVNPASANLVGVAATELSATLLPQCNTILAASISYRNRQQEIDREIDLAKAQAGRNPRSARSGASGAAADAGEPLGRVTNDPSRNRTFSFPR